MVKEFPGPTILSLRTGALLVFSIIRQGGAFSIVLHESGRSNDVGGFVSANGFKGYRLPQGLERDLSPSPSRCEREGWWA